MSSPERTQSESVVLIESTANGAEDRGGLITDLPWRTGRKVGRTIYVQVGPEPSDDDVLIGVMDHPELAAEAVRSHNAALGG